MGLKIISIEGFDAYKQRLYDTGEFVIIGHGTVLRDWDSDEDNDTDRWDDYSDGWWM